MKKIGFVASVFVLTIVLTFVLRDRLGKFNFKPTTTDIKQGITAPTMTSRKETPDERPSIEIIAENLQIPWEIAFLPDGSMLVTERPGNLLKIGKDSKLIQKIEGVAHVGEGGLQGMALHPSFGQNNWIYLYFTTQTDSGLTNRIERYRLVNDQLSDKTIILGGIPGAQFHDGGRIEFGPDGLLYVTTGDAGNKASAQDINSSSGKILKINDDGSNLEVYSYGHRNPQGLAWDEQGRLWITEHGPSGIESGYDEVNLIVQGGNYGWPEIQGDQTREGMIAPVVQSGANDTWAPAGMVFFDGSFFFAGLRGETLYEAKLSSNDTLTLVSHFRKEYGRLRAVVLGPDNYLYLTTSNTDGRGTEQVGDDKIIRIDPALFR